MLHLGVPQSNVTYVHGAPDINDCNSHLSVILPCDNRKITHTYYITILSTATL